MQWIQINNSLIQATGRGFTFSVRKNSVTGKYDLRKESFTNGNDEALGLATQAEAIAIAERWDASR